MIKDDGFMSNTLNAKQRRAVHEYLISGNATDSLRKAGYSEGYAQGGSKFMKLPHISAYIEHCLEDLERDTIASATEVLELLTKQARREEPEYTVLRSGKVVETPTKNSDAVRALELLARRYGLLTEQVSLQMSGPLIIEGADELED